jgi:hypothetical protein
VHTRFAQTKGSFRVQRNTRHPGNLVTCEHQWPRIPFLARYARVDKDVLQLARAAAAARSQAEPRPPVSHAQVKPGAHMHGMWIIAARAVRDLDLRDCLVAGWADDLHVASHDTETQTTR